MYELNLVYGARQEGPTTRSTKKEKWSGFSGQNMEGRGCNKGTGKGEHDRGNGRQDAKTKSLDEITKRAIGYLNV